MVNYDDIIKAAERIRGVAHTTPVLTSRTLDRWLGANVFLKCENMQRAGAFKFRGAYNAIAKLGEQDRQRGVLAYSSGNHAQAVGLACNLLGMRATIVMPDDAPAVKRKAVESYGAHIVQYDAKLQQRETVAYEIQAERNLVLIPPFDHPDVIAGQGTSARELIAEAGDLDILLVPCGGGGLLSGSAIAAKQLSPSCRVIGVEPELADDATRTFRSGTIQTVINPQTIADGARTPSLGKITFPLIQRFVDDIVTVSDADIIHTMRFVWERIKIIVEPTGVLGLAAAYRGRIETAGKRIGVVLSGGNVDLAAALVLFGSVS